MLNIDPDRKYMQKKLTQTTKTIVLRRWFKSSKSNKKGNFNRIQISNLGRFIEVVEKRTKTIKKPTWKPFINISVPFPIQNFSEIGEGPGVVTGKSEHFHSQV